MYNLILRRPLNRVHLQIPILISITTKHITTNNVIHNIPVNAYNAT